MYGNDSVLAKFGDNGTPKSLFEKTALQVKSDPFARTQLLTVLFHEFGHALQNRLRFKQGDSSSLLNLPSGTDITETSADLFAGGIFKEMMDNGYIKGVNQKTIDTLMSSSILSGTPLPKFPKNDPHPTNTNFRFKAWAQGFNAGTDSIISDAFNAGVSTITSDSSSGLTAMTNHRIVPVPSDLLASNVDLNAAKSAITKDMVPSHFAMGGAIPGYKNAGIISKTASFLHGNFGLESPFHSNAYYEKQSRDAKAKVKKDGYLKYFLDSIHPEQALAYVGPASGMVKNYAARMAATKLSPVVQSVVDRQGVYVLDKSLPKFVNSFMQLTGKKTVGLKNIDKMLTGYKGVIETVIEKEGSRLAPAILPGDGIINLYGKKQWLYKNAWDEGKRLGKIKNIIQAARGKFTEQYPAYENNSNIFMPKGSSWRTLFHELGHRDLDNASAVSKIILGKAANAASHGTHEIYADRFALAARNVISRYWDAGWVEKNFVHPFKNGESYVTNAGVGIARDFGHFIKGSTQGRYNQTQSSFLRDYLASSGTALEKSTVDRIKIFEKTLRGWEKKYAVNPKGALISKAYSIERILEEKLPHLAIGGSISGINVPKFDKGINMVPADMLAMLHKNEAVVPAHMNPFNPNANGNFGNTYNIAPVIHAAPGMDEQALVQMAVRQSVDAFKTLQYNESRTVGVRRSR